MNEKQVILSESAPPQNYFTPMENGKQRHEEEMEKSQSDQQDQDSAGTHSQHPVSEALGSTAGDGVKAQGDKIAKLSEGISADATNNLPHSRALASDEGRSGSASSGSFSNSTGQHQQDNNRASGVPNSVFNNVVNDLNTVSDISTDGGLNRLTNNGNTGSNGLASHVSALNSNGLLNIVNSGADNSMSGINTGFNSSSNGLGNFSSGSSGLNPFMGSNAFGGLVSVPNVQSVFNPYGGFNNLTYGSSLETRTSSSSGGINVSDGLNTGVGGLSSSSGASGLNTSLGGGLNPFTLSRNVAEIRFEIGCK